MNSPARDTMSARLSTQLPSCVSLVFGKIYRCTEAKLMLLVMLGVLTSRHHGRKRPNPYATENPKKRAHKGVTIEFRTLTGHPLRNTATNQPVSPLVVPSIVPSGLLDVMRQHVGLAYSSGSAHFFHNAAPVRDDSTARNVVASHDANTSGVLVFETIFSSPWTTEIGFRKHLEQTRIDTARPLQGDVRGAVFHPTKPDTAVVWWGSKNTSCAEICVVTGIGTESLTIGQALAKHKFLTAFVQRCEWSPDGSQIAVHVRAHFDRVVVVDVATRAVLFGYTGMFTRQQGIWSCDGRRCILSGDRFGPIKNSQTGEDVLTTSEDFTAIGSAFHPKQPVVAVVFPFAKKCVDFFDLDGRFFHSWKDCVGPVRLPTRFSSRFHSAAWSPTGRFLACSSGKEIYVWRVVGTAPDDLSRGRLVTRLDNCFILGRMQWSPSGKFLAAPTHHGAVLWDSKTWTRRTDWRYDPEIAFPDWETKLAQDRAIYAMSWNCDETLLLTANKYGVFDHRVRLWTL